MWGRKKRAAAARRAVASVMDAGGDETALLASVEVLREDAALHQGCENLIRAGNPERLLELLDRHGGGPPAPPVEATERVDGSGAAKGFAIASCVTWAILAAGLWAVFPGIWIAVACAVVGWVVSLVALLKAGDVAARIYEHYSPLNNLGALVFLALPPMLPIGLVWTVARAVRVASGRVDGPGRGQQSGGGYSYFEQGQIGAAGKPIAAVLLALALGYTACVAAVVVHGVLPTIEVH